MEINGYENYLIYPSGKVWSKASKRYLSPRLNKHTGYLQVELYKDRISKNHSIHRLLALHYIENPDNKRCVDHWDGNKTNNKLNNIRWASHSENSQNTVVRKNNKLGIKNICYDKSLDRYKYEKIIKGEKHQRRFKTLEEAVEYKKNYEKNI
jgi:hypothetical protein